MGGFGWASALVLLNLFAWVIYEFYGELGVALTFLTYGLPVSAASGLLMGLPLGLTIGWCIKLARRQRTKLREVKAALMRGRHSPVPQQGQWPRGVVQGYLNYHAIPGNMAALQAFRTEAVHHWHFALRRRSQRSRMPWDRFCKIADRWIPKPKIQHPVPNVRFFAKHPR